MSALLIGETVYQTVQIKLINQMLVFEERGKLEFPEKNLSGQSREPSTNSTHITTPGPGIKPGIHKCYMYMMCNS